jgi:hypothetical protein
MTTATPTRTTTRTHRRPELPLFSLPTDRDLRVVGDTTRRRPAKPAVPVFSDGR